MYIYQHSPLFHSPYPIAGTVVSVPIILGLRHHGIVSDRWQDGKPMVISGSNRMGCVVEESWDAFDPSGMSRIEEFCGPITGVSAVIRARAKLGSKYSLVAWNCDHVVHHAVGLEPKSPQLAISCLIGGVILVALANGNKLKMN